MDERIIAHIDMDAFFAAVEADRRGLWDEPLVVCVYSGRSENSGVVSTASYGARELGIGAAMPIREAMRKAKTSSREVHFVPMDKEFYREFSDRIRREVLEDRAGAIEQASIDEFYLDLTDTVDGYGEAEDLAAEVKDAIEERFHVTASVGIGPSRLVAKIGSDQDKPDGLTVVEPSEVEAFMRSLTIEDIHGIGEETRKTLNAMGITSVDELQEADRQRLVREFGENRGVDIWERAHGEDDTPVEESEPRQLSRLTTLDHDTRELAEVVQELPGLVDAVMAELEDRDMTFQRVAVLVVDEDVQMHSRSTTLETPVQDRGILRETARELLEEWLEDEDASIRRVGVRAAKLEDRAGQRSLDAF